MQLCLCMEKLPRQLGRLFALLRWPAMSDIPSPPADFVASATDPDSVPMSTAA